MHAWVVEPTSTVWPTRTDLTYLRRAALEAGVSFAWREHIAVGVARARRRGGVLVCIRCAPERILYVTTLGSRPTNQIRLLADIWALEGNSIWLELLMQRPK